MGIIWGAIWLQYAHAGLCGIFGSDHFCTAIGTAAAGLSWDDHWLLWGVHFADSTGGSIGQPDGQCGGTADVHFAGTPVVGEPQCTIFQADVGADARTKPHRAGDGAVTIVFVAFCPVYSGAGAGRIGECTACLVAEPVVKSRSLW